MISLRGLRQIIIIIMCVGIIMTIMCSCNSNNAVDIPAATSSDLPTEAPIKADESISQQLIGIWHAAPSIGSGYDNMFFFHKDNRFKLNYSQYDEEKRIIDISGKWTINENKLSLSVEEKTVIVGGELVDSSPSATSKYRIVNGTIQKQKVEPPEIIEYDMGQIENAADSPYENKLLINGEYYWKISDNPDNEHYNQQFTESDSGNEDVDFDKYLTYYNDKYGFSIKYPVSWDIPEEPPAGDGVILYNAQDVDIRFYGGYLLGDEFDTIKIDQAKNNGIPVEDFTTSNNQKGYKIIEKNGDRVKFQTIIYGQSIYCNLYADISSTYYEENEALLNDMAKSIEIFE